jgi:hypothetical protein
MKWIAWLWCMKPKLGCAAQHHTPAVERLAELDIGLGHRRTRTHLISGSRDMIEDPFA